MISFNSKIVNNYEHASQLEWLETNGIGGFSCSTISDSSTRRYHALLTAAIRPPLGRIRTLTKYEQKLTIDGVEYELSSNRYPDSISPEGYKYLADFRLSPFPVWIYNVDGVEIERRVFMIHGQNSTVCRWSVISKVGGVKRDVQLSLKPLLSFIDYHSLQKESQEIRKEYEIGDGFVVLAPFDSAPALKIMHNASSIVKTGFWYKNVELWLEKERGFDYREDLFQPFSLEFDLSKPAFAIATTELESNPDPVDAEAAELERRSNLIEIADAQTDFEKKLVLAADQFIVKRGDGNSIIAGYPWFSDWGRDTMIALPGLTLATNREGIARNIIREFSKVMSLGMLPNRFPDEGETPEYNTVDATLWYFEAIRAYVEKTGDYEFVRKEIYEKLIESIHWHQKGTRFGIYLDDDGLLHAGTSGTQLTWMDAKDGDLVFTPRIGKPVEIQALWFNALKTMEDFARRFRDSDGAQMYKKLARNTRIAFNNNYWYEHGEYLYDYIDGNNRYKSLRPNQIFAVSLRHSMLSVYRAKKVVQAVDNYLFTPVGLRTLSPNDSMYKGTYCGTIFQRDSAYHQGTAWAWLIGGFIESLNRIYPKGRKIRSRTDDIISGIEKTLTQVGIGQISEIFDGDEPHLPRGCFAQAWSVAEVLRILK